MEKDVKRAVSLFEEAGEFGPALCALAEVYDKGTGVSRDELRALKLYEKAVQLGNTSALVFLAQKYEEGNVVVQNKDLAFDLFKRAAESCGASGGEKFLLGRCYEDGIGCARDPKMAFQWYERSSNDGWSWATLRLGQCYADGVGTVKDVEKACKLYEQVANSQENDGAKFYALFGLGLHYDFGVGVANDLAKAGELYEEAVMLGVKPIRYALRLLHMDGQPRKKMIFLGNTGVGKSCLCNTIVRWGYRITDVSKFFKSMIDPVRITATAQVKILRDSIILDGPGLVDALPDSEKNKVQIEELLQCHGEYQIFIVLWPARGKRLRDATDEAMVLNFCSALGENVEISLITNGVSDTSLCHIWQEKYERNFKDLLKPRKVKFWYIPNAGEVADFLPEEYYNDLIVPALESTAVSELQFKRLWSAIEMQTQMKLIQREIKKLKKENPLGDMLTQAGIGSAAIASAVVLSWAKENANAAQSSSNSQRPRHDVSSRNHFQRYVPRDVDNISLPSFSSQFNMPREINGFSYDEVRDMLPSELRNHPEIRHDGILGDRGGCVIF